MGKKFEMTGSPKPFFKTKDVFEEAMKDFGWERCKIKKTNNQCQILVTDTLEKETNKIILAKEQGVEIMTYEDIVEAFDLEQ